jgi:ribosomal protein S18 acetylase RimI-like enzyme
MNNQKPPDSAVTYKPLRSLPADQLATFHGRNLSGKLKRLGGSYVQYFYETLLNMDDVIGWTASHQDSLVGLVVGSLDGHHLMGRVIRKNPLRWLYHTGVSALLHPVHFLRVSVSVLTESEPSHSSSRVTVLHYLAVRAEERHLGIGRGLMGQFAGELATRGQTQFELSVGRDNPQAIRFYEALGGKATEDYVAAGDDMRRYTFDVQKVLGRQPSAEVKESRV